MIVLPEWSSLGIFVVAALALPLTPGPAVLYCAIGAGTAARRLRANPRFVASERWVSRSLYIGLGLAAALSSGNRK